MHQATSLQLIEEIQTDGHSPAKFLCDDGKVYYVKYRSGNSFKQYEINCLVFELVCTRLLQELRIPTPELAFITIDGNSISEGQLKINKRYLRDRIIGLGSREIIGADILTQIEIIKDKREFNTLLNPADLIRIGIFDMWVDNRDRREDNYNILIRELDDKQEFIAIDHAFCFGGLRGMRSFNATQKPSAFGKLPTCGYYHSVIRFIGRDLTTIHAQNFVTSLQRLSLDTIIHEVFSTIPMTWQADSELEQRIVDFLSAPERIQVLQSISS